MKALSLHQPWASLVQLGLKTVETRHWATRYRGPLAIHAAKRIPTVDEAFLLFEAGLCSNFGLVMVFAKKEPLIPYGAVVATCELVDVVPIIEMPLPDDGTEVPLPFVAAGLYGHLWYWDGDNAADVESERRYGDYTPGRFAWILEDVKALSEPIPAKGHQGLWECEVLK